MTRPRSPAFVGALVAAALSCSERGTQPSEPREPSEAAEASKPSIAYGLAPPIDATDYPYDGTRLGPEPEAGATIYLSAMGLDGDSGAPQPLWSVSSPSGGSARVLPTPHERQVTFSATEAGPHRVALSVTWSGSSAEPGRVELVLRVRESACGIGQVGAGCRESLPVRGGAFQMGSPAGQGYENEQPQHPAVVADFELDRFEVTVARFRPYFEAYSGEPPESGSGEHSLIPGSGWQSEWDLELPTSREHFSLAFEDCGATFSEVQESSDALPLNCVNWYEAFAFCIAEGGRLPTEAEWEYASTGGAEQRPYPWGAEPPSASLAAMGCSPEAGQACSPSKPVAVGSFPAGAGLFGQEDLAGSLWEWVIDRYAQYPASCDNCAAIGYGQGRVFRGGSFDTADPWLLGVTSRLGFVPEQRDRSRGFRCARAVSNVPP